MDVISKFLRTAIHDRRIGVIAIENFVSSPYLIISMSLFLSLVICCKFAASTIEIVFEILFCAVVATFALVVFNPWRR